MINLKKKSQAALEFLTTYVWAFIIILITIAALAYFGVLSPSKSLPDRCNFGPEISCMAYVIADNGLQLKLKNNAGSAIIVDALTVSSEKIQLSCTSPIVGTTWESGDIKDVPIVCGFADAGLAEGEKVKLDVDITYHVASATNTFSKTVQGEVFALVGSGAVSGEESISLGTSCKDILDNGYSSGDGTYTIDPSGSSISVYCDMTTDGGGWTLVVRALAGSQAHNTGSAVGTLSSPTQGTIAKLSNAMIIDIGKSVHSIYENRFLFDSFSDTYYHQWNNGYAADFSNQRPIDGNPFEQTRKTSYGGSWSNEAVAYSVGCSGGYSPFSANSQCRTIWYYPYGCHSGFGIRADCSNRIENWDGIEDDVHRSGTMWVR